MQMSKLVRYSFGIVAENKLPSSKEVEVLPVEVLPNVDGEVTGQTNSFLAKGKTLDGNEYEVNVQFGNTLKCHWLSAGGNRITADDVRRGMPVEIYRFADSDKFYWRCIAGKEYLKKLESVIWAFSANTDEDVDELNPDNAYFLEVSSHKKIITLSTSLANGELASYVVQINPGDGNFVLQDNKENSFSLDSIEKIMHLLNADGTEVLLDKKKLYLVATDEVLVKTRNFKVIADKIDTKGILTQDGNATFKSETTFNTKVNFQGNLAGVAFNTNGATITFNGAVMNNGVSIGSNHTHPHGTPRTGTPS